MNPQANMQFVSPQRIGPELSNPDPLCASWADDTLRHRRTKHHERNNANESASVRSRSRVKESLAASQWLSNTRSRGNRLSSKNSGVASRNSEPKLRQKGSSAKRPGWLHAAIDYRRNPFTSSYCFVFKDRTTHNASEARAWSNACYRIDAERQYELEKKRMRQRHMASFRARQRAQYANDSLMISSDFSGWRDSRNYSSVGTSVFEGDILYEDSNEIARQGLQLARQEKRRRQLQEAYEIHSRSSSLEYLPATRSGTPAASRIAKPEMRRDVESMLKIVRARPRQQLSYGENANPDEKIKTTQEEVGASKNPNDKKADAVSIPENNTMSVTPAKQDSKDNNELRMSDLKKKHESSAKPSFVESNSSQTEADPRMDEVLEQLADARRRLAAMELNDSSVNDTMNTTSNDDSEDKNRITILENKVIQITKELEKQSKHSENLSSELKETSAALAAANQRIETEVQLRLRIEEAQKSILLQKDMSLSSSTPSSDTITMVPLDQVVNERNSRKQQFDSMLNALEKKRNLESARANTIVEQLREQLSDMSHQLEEEKERATKKAAELTLRIEQLQEKKDREFRGRETA